MSEWREVTLGDVVDITHGYAFKGEHFDVGGGVRLVTPGNFAEGGGFRDRGSTQKSYLGPIDDRYVLEAGDVVVAMTEQAPGLLGSSGLVPATGVWLHNQRIGRVVPRGRAAQAHFISHLFNAPGVRAAISSTATGTKVRHTAPDRLLSLRVAIPELAEQHRIAALLSSFDEAIAVNERRIERLESLARSMYRNCRESSGDRSVSLAEVAQVTMGLSPKSEHYNRDGEGLPFHQGVSDYGSLVPTHRVFTSVGPRIANAGDVLCSVRAPVGRLNIADTKLVVGRGLAAVVRNDDRRALLLEQLREALGEENSIGGGTIFTAIGKRELEGLRIAEPPSEVAATFEVAARPMLDERLLLLMHNRRLAAIRDLLLPRLVTGHLDISDVDLGVLEPATVA